MTEFIDRVGAGLDLVSAPFTMPGSRLLVLRTDDAITIRVAEYERPLDECVVVDTLRIFDHAGHPTPVSAVFPDRIEFGGGAVTATFAGPNALSIGACEVDSWSIELTSTKGFDGVDRDRWAPALPSASDAGWFVSGDEWMAAEAGANTVRLALTGDTSSLLIAVGDNPEPSAEPHAVHLERARAEWQGWFDRCPQVRDDLCDMTALCWWVLGANIVTLPGRGGARAVVPSLIGYVGLWQWDAYFIATGLRHGAPELAREQLDLAFGYPTAEGQLPDVVHDAGVLASSEDLPPQDRDNLRRAGSSIADPTAPIPLTKPPLAAWALRKVLEKVDEPSWANRWWETVARSQDWWFRHSDLDGDGMPEYGHPYSSGLDDSPIFDRELPVASPDLAAYLIVQDDALASHYRDAGDEVAARRHSARAEATLALLEGMWNDDEGFFMARGAGHPLHAYTAVSLLPLLTGRLSDRMVNRLLAALDDPCQFATPYAVPTVAVSDPNFSAERMWRGPVWININALLVEGLAVSGYAGRARELAERTVQLVIHGGGPHEYFNPITGQKAPTATTSFGWSAALFIDLAVYLSD